jgi:CRP/FNR family transcriptional regulator, cyclic AMP receptor protein
LIGPTAINLMLFAADQRWGSMTRTHFAALRSNQPIPSDAGCAGAQPQNRKPSPPCQATETDSQRLVQPRIGRSGTDLAERPPGSPQFEQRGPIMSELTSERARKVLEKCALFRALGERERIELAAHAQPRNFAANQPIFHLGEPGYSMMGVVVGTVRISLPTPKGRDVILADLSAGELFGEIALLDGKPRSANATALTNCELLVLERRDVLPFLERSPTACLNLMQMLCARVRRSDERMAEIAFFDLPARLARVLLRYPAQGRGPPRLSLSQRELAEMSGSTRENVNRCLRDWQRQGILDLKNRWTIVLKPEALHALEESF